MLKRSGWTMQDLSEGGVVARNKKEREEWRKKPALKPPQGVPHPPVHHYSHSSVSRIFHFWFPSSKLHRSHRSYYQHPCLQVLTLYHDCHSVAPHISCLKFKSCNSQHYHGAFPHHLQQHGCSSVTKNRICNIRVPQFWFTSSSSPNCPYPGWPQILGLCGQLRNHLHRLELFNLAVLFCFCLSVSFIIHNSIFHNS